MIFNMTHTIEDVTLDLKHGDLEKIRLIYTSMFQHETNCKTNSFLYY